ncbi:MAG: hypothetical protein ACR5KV_08130 [Wolbachia sp.]
MAINSKNIIVNIVCSDKIAHSELIVYAKKDSISEKLKLFADRMIKNAADKKDISIIRKDKSKFRAG